MTDKRSFSPIMQELLGADPHFLGNAEATDHASPAPTGVYRFRDLEAVLIRFYQSALGEDPSSMELAPRSPSGFQALHDVMFLMRILRELRRDFETGNPRCKTTLRILHEFFFESLNRSLT